MLKTGFKAFIYSFSVSLFAIISANKAFLHNQKPSSEALNIQNKTIALYLSKPLVSKAPTKKIALNTLSEIEKTSEQPLLISETEVVLANNLEPMNIPLEFIETTAGENVSNNANLSGDKDKIVLADVLYAPNIPLPEQKIEADPIYTPEKGVELKIVEEKIYTPEKTVVAEKKITTPPAPKKTIIEDNSLQLARNEKPANIPLLISKSHDEVNKISLGNPGDLQHVAYVNANIPIESMTSDQNAEQQKTSAKNKDWKHMEESPWVVAKSTGSKNVFATKNYGNKTNKEIAEALSVNNDKKGTLLASETAKNLIIPIPEKILNEKDISPQLAYPVTSDDKQKEIDINEKIKNEEKLKQAKEKNDTKENAAVLSPIEDGIEEELFADTKPEEKEQKPTPSAEPKEEKQASGIMDTITSIFNKSSKQAIEAREKIAERIRAKRAKKKKKKQQNDDVTIMPAEIRLSFQPSRAEISGQTLRWVQAFAAKVAQTPGMLLEVRIDGTSSTKLQQKRLNLLYNILTNKGLDYSLISTVFTSRDPNSFILRTVKTSDNKQGVNNQKTNRYIQW